MKKESKRTRKNISASNIQQNPIYEKEKNQATNVGNFERERKPVLRHIYSQPRCVSIRQTFDLLMKAVMSLGNYENEFTLTKGF